MPGAKKSSGTEARPWRPPGKNARETFMFFCSLAGGNTWWPGAHAIGNSSTWPTIAGDEIPTQAARGPENFVTRRAIRKECVLWPGKTPSSLLSPGLSVVREGPLRPYGAQDEAWPGVS